MQAVLKIRSVLACKNHVFGQPACQFLQTMDPQVFINGCIHILFASIIYKFDTTEKITVLKLVPSFYVW